MDLREYYKGDELAMSTWLGKYALTSERVKNPDAMHERMAMELTRIEDNYLGGLHYKQVVEYLYRYKYIIPQGSIMSMLGSPVIGSLSNCFVIPAPEDSYGGIFKTDQQIAQLEKRRGGVGTNLNKLRPEETEVKNAAGTSTGAHSFMDRFSNTTREVAQNGRRGALMLLMSCLHPDIFKFVTKKSDLTKVTGANVSVQLTDSFMKAVKAEDDTFFCRFPIDAPILKALTPQYNKLYDVPGYGGKSQVMKIHARELFDLIVQMAWQNGEPGLAFMDTVVNHSPEGVYEQFKPIASNPCGEQWMQAYDACRLLALNLYNVVTGHFTEDAKLDGDKLYEISYYQQQLADDIVDLEIEHVDRIINKILSDPEDTLTKSVELDLWQNIRKVAKGSRRTGCGFTAMADMLASLNLKYDSTEGIEMVKEVMKIKLRGELDATIDMAINRGTFIGWDRDLEFEYIKDGDDYIVTKGKNSFYQMLMDEFPEQANKMCKYGRRNCSWSTVAPTGTVSIVAILENWANTSAGVEPVFFPYYFRNKKVNPSDKNVRVDMVDQNGDHWMTYPVIMGGFKEFIDKTMPKAGFIGAENLTKEVLDELFKKSPYYGACANDIDWEKRIELQSIVQRYTTNAISSTLNLPNDIKKEVVGDIYLKAWELGLKGVTVYRDGCRTGVMNLTDKKEENKFKYIDAVKRPSRELPADLSVVTVKGIKYGVIVGLLEGKPYELFAFIMEGDIKQSCTGKIIKIKKGHYDFECENGSIKNIQDIAVKKDEQVLTRLISGMLRHGAKPQFVMEQIDKCELEVVSFGKAVSRVLKKYCSEEEMINRNTCKECGSANLKMQEGCLVCLDCSSSKCG